MESTLEYIEKITSQAQSLAKTKLELAKLNATQKTGEVISSIIALVAILFSITIALGVISVAVAYSIGQALHNISYGFYIIGSFYFILGLLFYFYRERWLKMPITNMIIDKLTK